MDATGASAAELDTGTTFAPTSSDVAPADPRAVAGNEAAGHLLGAKATCRDGVGTIHAYTSAPAQELELRMVPVFRAPAQPNGHWVQARESIVLNPLLHAPGSAPYYWTADVALGDTTCDDWKAQLEEVRARFDHRFEIGSLADRALFGFEPKPVLDSDIAPIRDAASADHDRAVIDPSTDTTGGHGATFGFEPKPVPQGEVAHVNGAASADHDQVQVDPSIDVATITDVAH
jgi:hypothetical protein